MKVSSGNIKIVKCPEGIHYVAHLELEWTDGSTSLLVLPTCFNSINEATERAQKDVAFIVKEMEKLQSSGHLNKDINIPFLAMPENDKEFLH